jgi:hypothetical protein
VISVDSCRYVLEPVEEAQFSTAGIHGANVLSMRDRAVFPVLHTPYDFYERI